MDDNRIEIDLRDFRMQQGNISKCLNYFRKAVYFYPRQSPEFIKQFAGANVGKHFQNIGIGNRRQSQGGVLENFRENATQTENNTGAESGKARHAREPFPVAFQHFRNQYGNLFPRVLLNIFKFFFQLDFVFHIQRDESLAAFVHDLPTAGFQS